MGCERYDTNFLFSVHSPITSELRKARLQQEPYLIWLTGLSGSGKSTLACGLEHYLFEAGYKVYLLDGDNIRKGINKDLGFSDADRTENIRRIAEIAKLMLDAGLVLISAFISPFRKDREMVKQIVGDNRFAEVFVDCPLQICEQRDVKGLYEKARKGILLNFTGISSPYEAPNKPDVVVHTDRESIRESLLKIVACIEPRVQLLSKHDLSYNT